MLSFKFLQQSRKHRVMILAVVTGLALIVFALVLSMRSEPVYSDATAPLPQPLQGTIVTSKNEIWPNKVLLSQETEYRHTAYPGIVAAYCVNTFEDESYTYEYIGLSKAPEYNVTCG
jgi:hypothetical protein